MPVRACLWLQMHDSALKRPRLYFSCTFPCSFKRRTTRRYLRLIPCARWRCFPSTRSSKAQLRPEVPHTTFPTLTFAKNLILQIFFITAILWFWAILIFEFVVYVLKQKCDYRQCLFDFRWKSRYHRRSDLFFQSQRFLQKLWDQGIYLSTVVCSTRVGFEEKV